VSSPHAYLSLEIKWHHCMKLIEQFCKTLYFAHFAKTSYFANFAKTLYFAKSFTVQLRSCLMLSVNAIMTSLVINIHMVSFLGNYVTPLHESDKTILQNVVFCKFCKTSYFCKNVIFCKIFHGAHYNDVWILPCDISSCSLNSLVNFW
jgi:hypothetical protein